MRRLALPILTICGLALLTSCSGGSGLAFGTSTTSPTVVVLYAGSNGQTNDFEIAPTGVAPLAVAAVGYTGSGVSPNYVVDATFTWAARYVNPLTDPQNVATYTVGPAPGTFKTCPAVPTFQPPVPILIQGGTGAASSFAGYTVLPATTATSQVFLEAVPGVTAPYCLVVDATSVNGHVVGSHTVIVSNSP
jgi:hypothetical protein